MLVVALDAGFFLLGFAARELWARYSAWRATSNSNGSTGEAELETTDPTGTPPPMPPG